jgi:hypothetical protein
MSKALVLAGAALAFSVVGASAAVLQQPPSSVAFAVFLVPSKAYKIGEFQKIPPGTHLERTGTD